MVLIGLIIIAVVLMVPPLRSSDHTGPGAYPP
jgi:hypothetical protein